MVPESGRITESALKTMLKLLQTFTLTYKDCDRQRAPKITVVFTNFTKHEETKTGDDEFEDDEEEAEEEKEEEEESKAPQDN